MGRFTMDQADHYGGQGGAGFFKIVNDGETARVRFLYGGIEDVEGCAVHQVKVNDKYRYVNCLRDYNEPKDACPFCREGMPQQAKLFIPLYNVDEGKIQIWDRGKKFFAKISSICSHYPNVVSQVFEVERHGKAGEQTTTYELFPVGQPDDKTLQDFELPDIFDGAVMDKSVNDMEYYLENGQFPPTGDADEAPAPRRASRDEMPVRRRTPANGGRDSF